MMKNILKAIRIYQLNHETYESIPEYIDIIIDNLKVQPFNMDIDDIRDDYDICEAIHQYFGVYIYTNPNTIEFNIDNSIVNFKLTAIVESDIEKNTEIAWEDVIALGKITANIKNQYQRWYIDMDIFDNAEITLDKDGNLDKDELLDFDYANFQIHKKG